MEPFILLLILLFSFFDVSWFCFSQNVLSNPDFNKNGSIGLLVLIVSLDFQEVYKIEISLCYQKSFKVSSHIAAPTQFNPFGRTK